MSQFHNFFKLLLIFLTIIATIAAETSINFQVSLVNSNSTQTETRNHDEDDPVLITSGRDLHTDNLGVKIIISIFLLIAYFDFIFQSVLLFYVFFQLVQTFGKDNKKESIFFAGLGITLFTGLRCTFVVFFLLPIPWDWAPNLANSLLVDVLIYLNVVLFIFFFGFSSLTCAYYMVFVGTTGRRMEGSGIDGKTGIEPMVVVLMPIYNEEPDALFRAVESAIRCNYPANRLHVFLAFDESSETILYFSLLKKLHVLSKEVSEEIRAKLECIPENEGNSEYEIFPPRLEWYIEGVRVTICRFPHEGKSPTQGKSFRIINDIYGNEQESSPDAVANTLILFIDSDIILHENAIHNFAVNAIKNPKIRGMTGLVTCRTSRNFNIYQYLQDAEYIDGQMFSRTAEATFGAVTCLPGALTLIRLSALQNVAPSYFIEIDKRRTVDFHRFHLGEDRYMTSLLSEDADGPYQVRFNSNATCKTDAPDTFSKLLKQRRRWFLGGFVNDVSTMISPVMWKKVPFVVLLNTYFYSSRGLSWILPIMLITMIVQQNAGIALYIIAITFGIRYILFCINALIMTRNKACLSYILLFFLSPIFNWIVNLYAVATWSVRSWGGPRTDDNQGSGGVASKLDLIDQVMSQREGVGGQTRKSLEQIKTMGRLIDSSTLHHRENNEDNVSTRHFGGSMRSVNSSNHSGGSISTSSKHQPTKHHHHPQLSKYVPFPYEAEFLGGGDYDMSDSSVVIPPTPKLSISMSPTGSVRSLRGFLPSAASLSTNFLSPQLNSGNPSSLKHSHSMPDLHTLSQSNAPYLFAKLSPEIQKRASSFRLDTDYLARVEGLATPENSSQRESSFNRRLSGRSSPGGCGGGSAMGSREPSLFNFDVSNNSPTSSYNNLSPTSPEGDFAGAGAGGEWESSDNFDDVVDIVIHVPDFHSGNK